jgi:arginine deiminase
MDSQEGINVSVNSEIGKLQHVLVHMPGPELEKVTPENAHTFLFSDILNMQVAQKEYGYFKRVLQKVTEVHEVADLLTDILRDENVKNGLVERICKVEDKGFLAAYLKALPAEDLSRQLIEGVRLDDVTFINKDPYALLPIPNLFFMRDASFTMFDNIMISNMATTVRARECMILNSIYNLHPLFDTKVINPALSYETHGEGTVEGGDVQIIRDDVVICGLGSRTNMHGVEALVEHLKTKPGVKHLIFQELPLTPESFIHLDMVFTMLDVDRCMIYEPVIMNSAYKTFHITVDGQKAIGKEVPDLLTGLKELGIDLEPVYCGNRNNDWAAREQWHSGCNFFCFEPGKFIGYGRNQHTLEALNNAGFNIVTASDVANGRANLDNVKKCIVAFEGNELSRGGGGARCMTMPVQRLAVEW